MRLALQDAISKIRKESLCKSLFVNVDRQEDYIALLDELRVYDTLKTSQFFNAETDSLKLVEIEKEISSIDEITVVLGLMSYHALKNGDTKIIEQVKHYVLNTKKLIFVCYGLSTVLGGINDVRLEESIVLIGNGGDGYVPSIMISKSKGEGVFESLSSFFAVLEKTGQHSGIVHTILDKQAFSKKWKVDVEPTCYSKIRDLGVFNCLEARLGDEKQWNWLLQQKKKAFSREEIELRISNWVSLSKNEKWQCFLSARSINTCYLNHVALKSVNLDEFISNIYNGLVDDFDIFDEKFSEYYDSRKRIVSDINDSGCLNVFCNLSKVRGANRIYYLTDCTLHERQQIIESIIEYHPSYRDLLEITQRVYPLLYEYLSDYDFGEPLLDNYFNQNGYKYYKLLNKASAEFLELVDVNGISREYGKLDSVQFVIKNLDIINAGKYWLDALGLEFAAFIKARAAFYGLNAVITPAVTSLPSTTEHNKVFLYQNGFLKDEALDDLKHARAKNIKYEKVANSIYLVRELEIVDEFIARMSAEIKSGTTKIIIASDHGASRLALVHKDQRVAIENNSRTADLRFAEAGAVDTEKYKQITSVSNGYHCVANYDYMKGGRTSGVEVHGGATLEEVVVPIIELTLGKAIQYQFRTNKNILVLKNKALDKFKIVLSNQSKDVHAKVNGIIVKPSMILGNEVEFDLGLDKVGEYEVAVFVDKNFIGSCAVKIISDLVEEIDLF